MSLNSQNFNQVLATFFTNEFLISIIPKNINLDKRNREDYLKEYRENIDNYCNSINSFMHRENKAYEIVLAKLVNFFKTYLRCDKNSLIDFACLEFCSKNYSYKFSQMEKLGLFRKFITECIKNFTAQALVNTTIYIDHILGLKKNPEETKFIKKKMVTNFELAITDIKNQIFNEFSCLEQGKDPSSITIISAENQMIEELRKQNEELRFDYLRIKNENYNLKQKILMLENIEKKQESESDSDSDTDSEQV